jgi:hypothetical protein
MRLDSGKIVIEVTLGNESMSRSEDVASILSDIAYQIGALRYFSNGEGDYDVSKIRKVFMDANGNSVATWRKEEVE